MEELEKWALQFDRCPWRLRKKLANHRIMYARKQILPNKSCSHIFFRCHNRQHFLEKKEVKEFLIHLWAKYKRKYHIKIYDFIIMDNHCHLLVRAENTADLGHFMRNVNSQLARLINKVYSRDSQAIRERYKSPVVTSNRYFIGLMQYIWMNRYKVNGLDPKVDRYCSASWRLYPHIAAGFATKRCDVHLLSKLLDDYPDHLFSGNSIQNLKRVIRDLLTYAMANLRDFESKIFENSHTIGDRYAVAYRGEYLSSFARLRAP